jgi:hypothetical protein
VADYVFPDFGDFDESNLAPDIDESGAVFEPLVNEEIPYGLTWAFDFVIGDVALSSDKKFIEVTEQATLREWINHTLLTARGETTIFSDDIGTDIFSMIGQTTIMDTVTMARIERQITEALLVHDRIDTVNKIALIPLINEVFVYLNYTTTDSEDFDELIAF